MVDSSLSGIGIVVGLAAMGHKSNGDCGVLVLRLALAVVSPAQLATACTVVLASGTGLPISTTQTLVGAVLSRLTLLVVSRH